MATAQTVISVEDAKALVKETVGALLEQKPMVESKIAEAKQNGMMPMMVLMPVIAAVVTPIISKYGEPKFNNPMTAVATVMGMAGQDADLKAGVDELQKLQQGMAMGVVPSDEEVATIKAKIDAM